MVARRSSRQSSSPSKSQQSPKKKKKPVEKALPWWRQIVQYRQTPITDFLLLLMMAGFGFDVLISPHQADPTRQPDSDLFRQLLHDLWLAPLWQRGLLWTLVVLLPLYLSLRCSSLTQWWRYTPTWLQQQRAGNQILSPQQRRAIYTYIAGYALRYWSKCTLGESFTYEIALPRGDGLVRHGPYRYLLHPSYTGSLLYIISIFSFGGMSRIATLLLLIESCIFLHYTRITQEEDMLATHFGTDVWEEYTSHRWRMFPPFY